MYNDGGGGGGDNDDENQLSSKYKFKYFDVLDFATKWNLLKYLWYIFLIDSRVL